MSRNANGKKPVGFATQLTAGGIAGAMEAVRATELLPFTKALRASSSQLCCQPLDTIKVRMQLSRSGRAPGVRSPYISAQVEADPSLQTKPRGFIATGMMIARRETPLALYKGLGAVLSGIVPKMAVRFASFEAYKGWLADKDTGKTSVGGVFVGASPFRASCAPR